MAEAPQTADYIGHFYKQKVAASTEEAAQLFAQGAQLQAKLEAETKRADEAEAKLKEASGSAS